MLGGLCRRECLLDDVPCSNELGPIGRHDVDRGLQDVFEARTGFGESRSQIRQSLACLSLVVADGDDWPSASSGQAPAVKTSEPSGATAK